MYISLMATLGEAIKDHRTAMKLSQREFGKLIGVTHTYVHNLETGKNRIPSPSVMARLAKVLRVTEESLLQSVGYLQDRVFAEPLGPMETWQRIVDEHNGDEDQARRFLYETLGEGIE